MNMASAPAALFARWCRFNLVGALGMVLQLAVLALFNRVNGGNYLLATAAAVELTLLHNFAWHLHYTWLDRPGQSSIPTRLFRFHLSNGIVSLAGNLALMRVLVHNARLPVVPANFLSILACSLVNFALSHCWVFTRTAPASAQ
ncbi:MAG TPA: GtrA family protein [Terracidiphilus sp.]|nr:GtrA family protein [Terracidiphilus sp.]